MNPVPVVDDSVRLAAVSGLGRALLGTGADLQQILDALAISLTASLCDGCSIVLMPPTSIGMTATRHRTGAAGDAVVHAMPFPRSELVRGTVTVSRGSKPFVDDDLAAIAACVEYASLALESALSLEARGRAAHFQKQLLGMVGHDLRAPLGSIVVGTELLEMDVKDNPDALSVVKRIEASAIRMRRMIDQLLDLTRARLGDGIPVARSKSPLFPIIQPVIAELAMTHRTAKLELLGADITGIWDPDRLAQAVSNLLVNALQYGREGTPIVVELATVDGAATITVHNTVRDEPIPPEALSKLFQPDRRGVHDIRYGTSGLGLGLYLVSEIVRAHGGSISAVSEGSRTSFRVVLPAG